jgi:hypothetical protein
MKTNPQLKLFSTQTLKIHKMKKLVFLMLLFAWMVNAQPPINNPSPLITCDDNNDGYSNFDLTSKIPEILGSLSVNDYSVTFYDELADATLGTNSVFDPTLYSNIGNVVYVRVEEIANNLNFATTTLSLVVNDIPFVSNNIASLVKNETPFDGIAIFDLTDNQASILNGQSNMTINYYLSQTNAQLGINSISNLTAFSGNHLQTIWVRVQNINGGCFVVRSFTLLVYDLADIVVFTDANLKQRLVNTSPLIGVATNSNNEFVSIDTNGDGEIQVSETLPIKGLNILNSNVLNITGIQAFTNLEFFDCTLNQITNIEVINSLTNLKVFKCINSGFTTLNLSTLTNLQIIDCSANNLVSINLTGLTNLKEVICINNDLQSLEFEASANLEMIQCNLNNISSINVSQLPNLKTLICQDNAIVNLDVSNNSNLESLYCGNLNFNNVNVTNLPNLRLLWLTTSSQTSLDFSNNPLLDEVQIINTNIANIDLSNTKVDYGIIQNNSSLTFLNLKNDVFITYGGIVNNPNLIYVCTDLDDITGVYNFLINPVNNNNPNVVVNSYCSFTPGGNYNTIAGVSGFDSNNNGCDAADLAYKNLRIDFTDGTNSGSTFTNNTGNYSIFTQSLDYTLSPSLENPSYFNVSPTVSNINFLSNNFLTQVQDFCVTPNGVHPDLEIVIFPFSQTTAFADAEFTLVYKNKGNQVLSGNVAFTFDDAICDLTSSIPTASSQTVGSLNWNYSNLQPFETRSIKLRFDLNDTTNPVFLNLGDILTCSATINPVAGDETPLDNTFGLNQTLVATPNLNFITCLEGNTLAPTEIGNYLHYSIQFENSGTEIANNVVVKNVIDTNKFDISSLQVISASSGVRTVITNNVAEFIFENIDLALRSGSPPVGGHGDILLKIKTKPDLLPGSSVMNTVSIYFDYNAGVLTNNETTTFAMLNDQIFSADDSLSAYPNPTNSIINLAGNYKITTIELYDIQGRMIQTTINSNSIDITNNTNGIYFLKVTSNKGSKIIKVIKE